MLYSFLDDAEENMNYGIPAVDQFYDSYQNYPYIDPQNNMLFPTKQNIDNSANLEQIGTSINELLDKKDVAKVKKNKMLHSECINYFSNNIINNNDMTTMSNDNSMLYGHVNKCKYCRHMINSKIKDYYENKYEEKYIKKATIENFSDIEEEKYNHSSPFYNIDFSGIKTIFLVILLGIFFIILLDVMMKISNKI